MEFRLSDDHAGDGCHHDADPGRRFKVDERPPAHRHRHEEAMDIDAFETLMEYVDDTG